MDISTLVELTPDREWKIKPPPDMAAKDLPRELRSLAGFRLAADGRARLPATESNLERLRRCFPHIKADPSLMLRDLLEALEKKDYNISTRRLYFHYNRKFLLLTGLAPDRTTAADLRNYLGSFASRAVSRSTQGLMYSALRFYYDEVRGCDFFRDIGRPRAEPRAPVILKPEEVEEILDAARDPMFRAVLALVYSGGLRAGEAAVLRRDDILRYRGFIRVTGPPERLTLLTEEALDVLDEYLSAENHVIDPDGFLFIAPRREGTISARSIERAFTRACRDAGMDDPPGVHALRHAFAANALRRGASRRQVAAWLGFKSVRSLRPYLSG